MDIQQNVTSIIASRPTVAPDEGALREEQGAGITAALFAQLLQGVQAGEINGLEAVEQQSALPASALVLPSNTAQTEVKLDNEDVLPLSMDSLLGQSAAWAGKDEETTDAATSSLVPSVEITDKGQDQALAAAQIPVLSLDQLADTAVRDGRHVLQTTPETRMAAASAPHIAGAQPHIATGQQVATVAAGVLPAAAEGDTSSMAAEPVAMATNLLLQTGLQEDGMADAVQGLQEDRADREGRFALQGDWVRTESDTMPSATMQRLMGQIEQWAATGAGVQPRSSERTDGGRQTAAELQGVYGEQGSGTRLTENAVLEAQQAEAMGADAGQEVPVEDMRFWIQGRQQRAELMLERDGQTVRVQVSVNGNDAQVTFLSDQAQTREALDASLAQLRNMLAQQGVQLLEVSVQSQTPKDSSPQQDSDNAAAPQEGGQHAQIAVPSSAMHRSATSRMLDLYA